MGEGSGVATVRVHVLGGFSVDGIDEHLLGTRKARLVLKRLAVAGGRPVAPDDLAEAVWADELPSRPSGQLSVLVSRLRAVLGADRIVRTDAGYAVRADWLDVVELQALADEMERRLAGGELGAALAAAQAALAIPGGVLLPEEDAAWIDEARPPTERLVARTTLLAAEVALAAGQHGAARAAAQRVIDHDPYDEAALRVLMRAEVAAGRPSSGLAAYGQVRRRLADELGVDPAPETEALYGAIVRGEVTEAVEAPAVSGIVGRREEWWRLDELRHEAARGPAVMVVIEGDAGIGKSTLIGAWAGEAEAAGALVLAGRCDELGGDLPLQPVVDALAAHLAGLGRDGAAEVLGDEAQVLDPLLGRGVPVPRSTGVTTVVDADTARTALYGALAAVLARLAGDRLLIVCVDDLHRAAPGTAEFLLFAGRRLRRIMIVGARRPQPGPDLPAAQRIVLAPLTYDDAAALVGDERAAQVYDRSGGHPLFLKALAGHRGPALPATIVDAVRGQLAGLGDASTTLVAAAVCGAEVDADLIAAVTDQPVSRVLDQLEAATRMQLLVPRGVSLAFRHELIREAVEAVASPSRHAVITRRAVEQLATRPDADPLVLARLAQRGGDRAVAARALLRAADLASERADMAEALRFLDTAVGLDDSHAVRLARGRARLVGLDLGGAAEDAAAAIAQGAGTAGFELAGWVAYYQRDFDTALRYAEEGAIRAGDDVGARASCLALAGRVRHTRGELGEARVRLDEAVLIAPPSVRGVAQIWSAQLHAHQGDIDAAIDLARRALLDPHLGHPFAAGHGRFTLIHALAMAGRWSEAWAVCSSLEAFADQQRRFVPVAANMRGWMLRGIGALSQATEAHARALDVALGPTFLESHYAARLDLAEIELAGGDVASAAEHVAACGDVLQWSGSMHWRHRNRYHLLTARLASLGGDHGTGGATARAVAAAAQARGDLRYRARALIVAATADARAGSVDAEAIGPLVTTFVPLAGPDGWRDLAELADASGLDAVWAAAETHAAALIREAMQTPGVDGSAAERAVANGLQSLRTRLPS